MVRTAVAIPVSSDRNLFAAAACWRMRASLEGAIDHPEFAKAGGANQRIVEFLKTAVAPIASGAAGALQVTAQQGFFTSLQSASAFFQLLNNGSFIQLPFTTKATVVSTAASGVASFEGESRPVTSMSMTNSTGLTPVSVSATVVVSNELLQVASAEAEQLIDRELKQAVATAADTQFLSIISAAATSMVSSGSTLSAMLDDLKRLLGAVNIQSGSRPVWIGPAAAAKAISIGASEDPSITNGSMGMMGGSLFGAPFLVSPGVSDGNPSLFLIDAAAVSANATGLSMQIAKHASLQMDGSPDSPETTSTKLVSLWQRNLTGIRASAYIGAELFRTGAAAEMTSLGWATSSPSSP